MDNLFIRSEMILGTEAIGQLKSKKIAIFGIGVLVLLQLKVWRDAELVI